MTPEENETKKRVQEILHEFKSDNDVDLAITLTIRKMTK